MNQSNATASDDLDALFDAVYDYEDYSDGFAPPRLTFGDPLPVRWIVQRLLNGIDRDALDDYLGVQARPEVRLCVLAALRRGGVNWAYDPVRERYWVPQESRKAVEGWLSLDAQNMSRKVPKRRKTRRPEVVYTYGDLCLLRPKGRSAWLERARFDAHRDCLLKDVYGVDAFYFLPLGVRAEFLACMADRDVPYWCRVNEEAVHPSFTHGDAGEQEVRA